MNFAQMLMTPTAPLFPPDSDAIARTRLSDQRYLDAMRQVGTKKVTARQIASIMGINSCGVSRRLQEMEERGLVQAVGYSSVKAVLWVEVASG